ncbi:MAG: hypothetical protein H7Y42_18125 [Chitinophagaceae bacterium]|nr:hypothetical protein [Chitinophagaceae bacterium]
MTKPSAILFARFIYSALLILTLFELEAQPRRQFLFSHLGTRNGLISNQIMSVAQDDRGFIWIATLNGLQRYDGRRFITFQHRIGDPYSLPNNAVHSLYIDRKNRLWMKLGENRLGYMTVNDNKFHEVPVRYPEMTLRNSDSRFIQDNKGNLLLILTGFTVFTFDETANEFATKYNPFPLPAKWKALDLSQDYLHNNYWIACDSGLVKYDPAKKEMSYRGHNLSNDPVIAVFSEAKFLFAPYLDRSGRFWLLSWPPRSASRFYSYDIKKRKLMDWDPAFNVLLKGKYHETVGVREQKDSTIWVYGNNLFATFNEKKKGFELIESNLPGEFSIRYDAVRGIFEDRENNLWVAANKGLFRFNPAGQFFRTVPSVRYKEDTIYTPDIADILQTRDGDILTASWGSGVFSYDNDMNPIRRDYLDHSRRMGEGLTWCIVERPNGDIWRGNQDGTLFITSADRKRTEKIRDPIFKGSTIRQITEDKKGNLWLGTQSGLLVKWDAEKNSFSQANKFGSIIFRLYTDNQGDIWVCTRGHGVFRINPSDGKVITNYTADGPRNTRLLLTSANDIIQFDDSLYMIASGALNILNIRTQQIRYFSSDNGLPSNSVSNVVKDNLGQVWLTTESGICTYNIRTAIAMTFNESDGLENTSFNGGSACVLKDGRIAIGTAHDFIVFNPSAIAQIEVTPPNVTITGFAVGNNWLQVDSLKKLSEIKLKSNENAVTIEFSTLTFQNTYGISYMMEGLDKTWIRRASSQTQAVYNYLPPGDYTFKVRSENGNGVYSRTINFLKIDVQPPFWRTWWFFCLLALVVASIIYWLDRQRVNKLVELQNVRTEIAANLHEEVNTTLNNINLLSEMARIKADKEVVRSKEYIDQISSKSHNMIIAMDDILWSIDPRNDTMEKSLLRMMEFTDSLKHRHAASIEMSIDKRVRALKLNMKTRHEAFLIFKEALRVIVQYSGGRDTQIHVDLFKNKLSVRLQDSTATLDKHEAEIDSMIRDMNERSTAIGADLDVQYDKRGIAIILLVPVR